MSEKNEKKLIKVEKEIDFLEKIKKITPKPLSKESKMFYDIIHKEDINEEDEKELDDFLDSFGVVKFSTSGFT